MWPKGFLTPSSPFGHFVSQVTNHTCPPRGDCYTSLLSSPCKTTALKMAVKQCSHNVDCQLTWRKIVWQVGSHLQILWLLLLVLLKEKIADKMMHYWSFENRKIAHAYRVVRSKIDQSIFGLGSRSRSFGPSGSAGGKICFCVPFSSFLANWASDWA